MAHDDRVDAWIGPHPPRRRHAVRPRYLVRKHLIEDDPGGVDVRTVVHGMRHADLFGSHVAESSCDTVIVGARAGAVGPTRVARPKSTSRMRPRVINEDVFRLDVAVNDPRPVSMLKRFGDLWHVVERATFGDRSVPLLQKLPEARPLHVFHHQAIEIPRLLDVEHRHNERMTQLRQRTPLAEEPLLKPPSVSKSGRMTLMATSRSSSGWRPL